MTRRMLRHEIPVDDKFHAIYEGVIRHIATRRPNVVEVWAEHDDDPLADSPPNVHLTVVGTGQEWPPKVEWIGTALAPGGLVWHLLAATS